MKKKDQTAREKERLKAWREVESSRGFSLEWRTNSQSNPWWKQNHPLEIRLMDDTIEQFYDASVLPQKRQEYRHCVVAWRFLNPALLPPPQQFIDLTV